MTSYKRPPIAEAIAQFQFAEPNSDRDLDRVIQKAGRDYPQTEPLTDYDVEVRIANGTAVPKVVRSRHWAKLSSKDGADGFVLNRKQLTVVRLAPYLGWDAFFEKIAHAYELYHNTVGFKRIERIGLRYINRIDVPAKPKEALDISRYLKVYPNIPHLSLDRTNSIFTRFEYSDEASGLTVLVTSGNSDPILLNHQSYMLDIDVIRLQDIAMRREDLLAQLCQMRDMKNQIFESLITDTARAIFDA